jgi:hypothetical protein
MWMRNQSMRMMTRWPFRNLFQSIFRKADAIALHDYASVSQHQPTARAELARA